MSQILPLMKNRFGNFLVQCCLDCGTPAQAAILCEKIKGHVVALSCDRFGCHVMQKTIEKIDDDAKLRVVAEMVAQVYETFTHRFSCHVWQRIFEAPWTKPHTILEQIRDACEGRWAVIANDENGSLVVQCIFEHCSKEEKQAVVSEIFMCTADISKGTILH